MSPKQEDYVNATFTWAFWERFHQFVCLEMVSSLISLEEDPFEDHVDFQMITVHLDQDLIPAQDPLELGPGSTFKIKQNNIVHCFLIDLCGNMTWKD